MEYKEKLRKEKGIKEEECISSIKITVIKQKESDTKNGKSNSRTNHIKIEIKTTRENDSIKEQNT